MTKPKEIDMNIPEFPRLVKGEGAPGKGACWMSALNHMSGNERWTGKAECVDPVIRELCIRVNDSLPSDADRERVIAPILMEPYGTNQGIEWTNRRLVVIVRVAVTVWVPAALRSVGLTTEAESLESLTINGPEDYAAANAAANAAVRAAASAARDARAADAAAYAARDARAADAAADTAYAARDARAADAAADTAYAARDARAADAAADAARAAAYDARAAYAAADAARAVADAAYAAADAARAAAYAAEHLIVPLILELCEIGREEREPVRTVRTLADVCRVVS